MSINAPSYYRLRARQARELAAAAADPKIAAIHAEMAEQYDTLAAATTPGPTLSVVTDQGLRSVSA